MKAIHDFFSGKSIPVIPPPEYLQTFVFGGNWGDRIELRGEWPKTTDDKLQVAGWKNPMPKEGDILLIPMQSGKTLKCKFIEVRPCGDPADMFFADVEPIRYTDGSTLYQD